jgi:hypothetical protein
VVETTTVPEQDKSIPQVLGELKDLSVSYARQETIEPLKGLGRFVGFGVGGSVLLGVGVCLLVLGGLRALQTETGSTFTGNWSWAPYLLAFVLLAVLATLSVLAISRDSKRAKKERDR